MALQLFKSLASLMIDAHCSLFAFCISSLWSPFKSCSASSSNYSLSFSTFSLLSALLSNIFLATLVWSILIISPNYFEFLLSVSAIRSRVLNNFHISWLVLIFHTPFSVTGPCTLEFSSSAYLRLSFTIFIHLSQPYITSSFNVLFSFLMFCSHFWTWKYFVSHNNIAEYDLPGCNTMQFGRSPLMFWRNTLPPFPGSKSKQSKMVIHSSNSVVDFTELHSITTLKIMLFIVTDVRSSNETYHWLPRIILILLH